MRPGPVLVVLAALFLPGSSKALAAPEPPVPAPGDRVRLLVFDERPIVGRLLALDSLDVEVSAEPDSARRSVPLSSIAAMDVERTHGRVRFGAALGFVAGGVAGILLQSVSNEADAGEPATTFITGAAIGTVVGAILGRAVERKRWHEGALPRSASIGKEPWNPVGNMKETHERGGAVGAAVGLAGFFVLTATAAEDAPR